MRHREYRPGLKQRTVVGTSRNAVIVCCIPALIASAPLHAQRITSTDDKFNASSPFAGQDPLAGAFPQRLNAYVTDM
jgi:hypothetical protein